MFPIHTVWGWGGGGGHIPSLSPSLSLSLSPSLPLRFRFRSERHVPHVSDKEKSFCLVPGAFSK